MAGNENCVNIEPALGRDAYHHGDLRSALIEAGMHALSTDSADALSLRALAREVGVSATAVDLPPAGPAVITRVHRF